VRPPETSSPVKVTNERVWDDLTVQKPQAGLKKNLNNFNILPNNILRLRGDSIPKSAFCKGGFGRLLKNAHLPRFPYPSPFNVPKSTPHGEDRGCITSSPREEG
jgi:hypothetical protein